MPKARRGGRKGRKIGRNKVKCEKYRLSHRREKNKIRKINRHLKVHINDWVAKKRVDELRALI